MKLAPIQIQAIGNQISFLDGSVTEIMELNNYPIEIYTDENLEGSKLVVKNFGNISIEEAGSLEYKLERLVIYEDEIWGKLFSSGIKINIKDKEQSESDIFVDEYTAELFYYTPIYELSEIPNVNKIIDYKQEFYGILKGYFTFSELDNSYIFNGVELTFKEGEEEKTITDFTNKKIELKENFLEIPKKPLVNGKLITPNKIKITSRLSSEDQENILINLDNLELSLESYNQEDGEYYFILNLDELSSEKLAELKKHIKLEILEENQSKLTDYENISGKITATFKENNFNDYSIKLNIGFSIPSQGSEGSYEITENFVSTLSSKNSNNLESIFINGKNFNKNEIDELDLEIEDIETISIENNIFVRYYEIDSEGREKLLKTKKISKTEIIKDDNDNPGYLFYDITKEENSEEPCMVYFIPQKEELNQLYNGIYLIADSNNSFFVEIDLPGKIIEEKEIQSNSTFMINLQTSEVKEISFLEYGFEEVDVNTNESNISKTNQFLNLYSTTLNSKFLPSKTSKILIGIKKEKVLEEDNSIVIDYITNGLEINVISSILNSNWIETEFNYENYVWGYKSIDDYGNIQFYSEVEPEVKEGPVNENTNTQTYFLDLIPKKDTQIYGELNCIYIDLTELELEKITVKFEEVEESAQNYYKANKIDVYKWNPQDGFYLLNKLEN